MNGRLKIIEQQLLGIDSAAFQNLCDVYLFLRERELASINRTGSQLGKQKTTKGTPDTFFRLADGSLRYVEYTTKADGIVGKIKEDLDKCLDSSITGVPTNEISKIIIFFNSRLTVAQETEITQYAVSKNIRIELIGLDWLALEIYSKYLILAKDILGIALDTGQLLPLQNFVEEYNNKGGKLSTPLDNAFLHRKTELIDIEKYLSANDLLVISGFPGVGKTKIALEAINKFLIANTSYSAFAVSKKDQDISEDLKIHLQQDRNYILLVDDANRQLPNFKQILGAFKEKRRGNIKLIITVRDYALNDVEIECMEFSHDVVTLKKFTDEEITQLISTAPFDIINTKFQKRIVEIADGNARLAIMASRLAQQEQVGFLYGDGQRIFELYDYYFKTFIKDFDIFGNSILVKTLGLVSFFFTIDRSDKKFFEGVLGVFEIDYYEFNEAIDELEKRELIEVQYNHARVSEQVMATYFFYKVFIKDGFLSFKTLIFNFFPEWKSRFSDTIIPSNNSFGYQNVLDKISATLDEYLYSIYSDEEKVLKFLELFWFYKRQETLNYFHSKIKALPEPVNPNYSTKYETNDFVWDRDKTLDFLSNLFSHYSESFIPSFELSFELCRKKPELLPELIRRIREKVLFDDDDHHFDFQRQVQLFKLLTEKFKEKQPPYVQTYFALSGTFLAHHYRVTKAGRQHSIIFYEYPLPFYDTTKEFRRLIWETLLGNYTNYPNETLAIIRKFRLGFGETIKEILEFDLSFLLPFVESKLDTSSFENIHFVNDLVLWLDREDLADRSYQNLRAKFKNKDYEYFRKLDWNSLRGKQDYEFQNFNEFQKLKEQDIRTSFVFQSEDDFKPLHSAIKKTLALEGNNVWMIQSSLNIITEENFIRNENLGFALLRSILNDYPNELHPLTSVIKAIVQKSHQWALRLWNLLKSWKHEFKIYWQLSFFDFLPNELANNYYKRELLETINSIERGCYLRFESYEKFIPLKSDGLKDRIKRILNHVPFLRSTIHYKERNVIEEILSIVHKKIEDKNLRIQLSYHFFEKYTPMLADNFNLLGKSYIQQEKKVNNHFDIHHEGFKALLQIEPAFLLEYIDAFYIKKDTYQNFDTNIQLPFVWDIKSCIDLMETVANTMISNTTYFGILEHPLVIFFNHANQEQKIKGKDFLINYITKYHADSQKMNAVFDVFRHRIKDFFDEAFLYYLSLESDVDNFKKIYWRGNGGTYSGDVIIGDIEAKEWQGIFEAVNQADNQLDLIPIKTYLRQQIDFNLRRGEEERKRRFTNPDRW